MTAINLDLMRERFLVFDRDGDVFAYSYLTEDIMSEAYMVLQIVFDPDSGFSTSRVIKNRTGETE